MPKSLLLADDSTTIRTAVGMIFKTEDVTVTAVADGKEALSRAKELKPDLIVADVSMPGLGGYELCERVRADGALRHIPVLLLGGAAPIDPAKAIAVGANGHLPKPFESQKLLDHVKQILANPKAVVRSAPPAPPPAMRPPVAGAPSRPPPAAAPRPVPSAPAALRPSVPPPRPPSSVPPRVPAPGAAAARPAPAPAGRPPPPPSRPPAGPASRPPAPAARPAAPAARSAPPPAAPRPAVRPPPPQPVDDEIPMEEEVVEETPALRAVPGAASKPPLAVVPGARGDGGEAMLRDALSKASREVIEKIAWEVVPELAETIIREELERLIKERGQ
jgi:CheY-like chemotaxis protein